MMSHDKPEEMSGMEVRHLLEQRDSSLLAESIERCPIPVFVLDRQHRVVHWNRACEVLTGIAAADIVGSNEHWRAFYPTQRPVMADLIVNGALEQDVNRFYHGKYRASTLIPGAFEAEDFFPHFGEQGRWLFFTAAPLRDTGGRFLGAIETLQDITEQKIAEQALRDSEARYRTMSITDALTLLYNSRHFYDQLGIEAERAARYRRPLSMLLIDADNFKQLNDAHGHLEGDRALQMLAAIIRSCLRSTDSAYRYGGEEFTVLLPEVGLDAAAVLAERMRQAFADSPLTLSSGAVIHSTISIGISEYLPPESLQSFIRRADDGVYRAKHQGRNCIVAISLPG